MATFTLTPALDGLLTGNTGNDTFIISLDTHFGPDDFIIGGAGTDTLRFTSKTASTLNLADRVTQVEIITLTGKATLSLNASAVLNALVINGNKNANVITGTGFSDTFNGNSGNDTLNGGDGNDTLNGNSGNDTLNGGDGNDTLNGNSGNDTLNGGGGNGTLNGGAGRDTLNGGAGNDLILIASTSEFASGEVINGDADTDTLRYTGGTATLTLTSLVTNIESVEIASVAGLTTGTASININATAVNNALTISGNSGANILTGTAHADTLNGKAGNDTLNGGLGEDTLNGGAGNDTLNGGDGNDIFLISTNAEFTGDKVNGGNGFDTLVFNSVIDGETITLLPANVSGLEKVELAGTADLNVDVSAMTNSFVIDGNAGDNSITGTSGADTINGKDGNDTITGQNGNDTLNGGDGDDVIVASAGDDIITGGLGADTMNGGDGNDTLNLVSNDDYEAGEIIDGGIGNDTISLTESGQTFDLTSISDTDINNIEIISLDGGGNNTLILDSTDVLAINSTHTLRVDGTVTDTLITNESWVQGADVTIDSKSYAQYTLNGATLQINTNINFADTINLANLNGTNGCTIIGETAGDHSGFSVSTAGDVNGDGFDDLIIGAPDADPNGNYSGASFVIFGQDGGFPATFDLSEVNGTNGFKISGELSFDRSGRAVSDAGDINGDGYDDLIIGAARVDLNGADSGATYIVFGKASGFSVNLNLSTLNGTNGGFQINGESADDESGFSVSAAGDINGDGFDDLLIAARFAIQSAYTPDEVGVSYVVFGKDSNFPANFSLSALNGANGFRLPNEFQNDLAGHFVSNAGDVNGDGFDDLIIGTPNADPNGLSSGASYVVFGKSTGFTPNIELRTLNGINGFQISGEAAGDFSGRSVSTAGDVNGDGYADLIIGAYDADPNGNVSGASYVVFGKASGFGAVLNLSTLDGTNGFQISGKQAGDQLGFSVSTAGDINGDGYDDLIISTSDFIRSDSYVVYGKNTGFTAELDVSELTGDDGFRILGAGAGDESGFSVSTAGDVNGDGFDDLIIGAPYAYSNGYSSGQRGASHVVFGGDFRNEVDFLGTDGDDILVGNNSANILIGGLGNDTLSGGAGNDVLIGAAGNDILIYNASDTLRVDGGSGTDMLQITGNNINFDLTTVNVTENYALYTNIEVINLTGVGNNTLTLNSADLLHLSDSSNTLRINGNTGDAVITREFNWVQGANVDGYTEYTLNGATLLIDSDITFNPAIHLIDVDGTNGFRLKGEDSGDWAGWSVSSAGDINGDGFADFLVGARGYDYGRGSAYVVLGKNGGFSNTSFTNLGDDGFRIIGEGFADITGYAVSSAGDVNGDGFTDVLIGARNNGPSFNGAAYIVFGKSDGFTDINLADINGPTGFQINFDTTNNYYNISVSTAGDINGDGFADILIGNRGYGSNNNGAAYVVFGKVSDFSNINLETLPVSEGFQITGEENFDRAGVSVSTAGDVNGDGFADILIGAIYYGPSVNGAAYVIFGNNDGFADISLTNVNGINGFRIIGETYSFAGFSVSSAGDVNGDGFDDILIGVPLYGTYSEGKAYVVFGKSSGFADIHLESLLPSEGFHIFGGSINDFAGNSVSSAGDVNGDGYDDMLIAAPYYRDTTGAAYVVFGKNGAYTDIDLKNLSPTDGFQIIGEKNFDRAGVSVSAAGDINGDGFSDLLIGADGYGLGNNGASYVIFGSDFRNEVDFLGDENDNTLTGNGDDNILIGGLGNDTLNGGAGNDVLKGAGGNDTLTYDASDRVIAGGTGTDTLIVTGSGVTLDLTAAAESIVSGIELIDLTGSGNNSLTIDANGLVAQTEGVHTLRVDGNAGDTVTAGTGWFHIGTISDGGQTYAQYLQGAAILEVDTDITHDITLGAEIDLSSLNGANGFQISGEVANDKSGFSVSSAGDVNGDGFADLLIGAYGADPNGNYSGASYVVFGRQSDFSANLNLSTLDGTNGFKISGANHVFSGRSVSNAGDVNGDGLADLLIGAEAGGPYGNPTTGASYVVFGSQSDFSANLNLSTLDGTNGFKISGEAEDDRSGYSVSSAGDVNGDGFADLLIGAPSFFDGPAGKSYVVFGSQSGFAANLDLSSLNGTNGFKISGEAAGDHSGNSVSSAGDVNGDGFDDVLISTRNTGPNGTASYVVFGSQSGFSANLNLSNLDGTNGFKINGEVSAFLTGAFVSNAGDVNGDGLADLLIGDRAANLGTPYGNPHGASYVVFGSQSGFSASLNLSSLNGTNGFRISGEAAGDYSGRAISSAGDVNGDGFADLIIGAFGADPNGNYSGASYVVFGSQSGFAANLDLSTLDGSNGFQINGEAVSDFSGFSVASAGDVNGDGFDDLIIGASRADPHGLESGASYVIFGGDFRNEADFLGDENDNTLTGNADDNILVGGLGNDTLNGGAGNDVLTGGGDNDILNGDDNNDFLRGGTGNDTLNGDANNDRLEGDEGNDTLDGGAGNDTLTGGAGNDVFLFNDALSATNIDTIMDFGGAGSTSLDVIHLENSIFTALTSTGALNADNFLSGTSFATQDANDFILYDTSTGELFYDTDGNGGGAAIKFAALASDPDGLAASDFVVV